MYYFAFRSRTQSMKLYDAFSASGIDCRLLNTPREIAASCGLSVRVANESFEQALAIFRYYKPETLIGVFYTEGHGFRRYL